MKKHSNKIYDCLMGLLIVIFPFSRALPNIVLPLIIVFFILSYKRARLSSLKTGPIIVLYILMAYIFIKGAISQSLFTEFNFYNKLFIVLLLPVLFTRITNGIFIKSALLLSIYATIFTSLFLSVAYYIKFGTLPFNTGPEVNKILVLERPYAGFYALTGAILSIHMAQYFPRFKWALRAASVLAVFFIVFIAARLSLLSLLIILAMYVFFYSGMPAKKSALLLVGTAAVIIVLISFSGSLSKRFFINDSIETAIDYEPRVVIWNCAWHMLQRPDYNYVVGFCNNNKVQDYYVQCFDKKIDNPGKREWYLETRFNSHNQFNDFMLVHGITGFLLLVIFIGWMFVYVKNDFAPAAITLGLMFFLLVENVLHRQMGCYFFSILAGMLLVPVNIGNNKN